MKKSVFSFGLALAAIAMLPACGNSDKTVSQTSKNTTAAPLPEGASPNYRFVNFDSICAKYNLAIDFTEQMMRLQNNYDSEEKKLGTNFQTRYASFMKKQDALAQERVQLPSEVEALQKEGEQLQKDYQKSQESLSKLQVEIQQTMVSNSAAIMDSIQNFLKDYVPAQGYEAVFFSESVPYYHPSLDITDEVVEGLNARYNKVKK